MDIRTAKKFLSKWRHDSCLLLRKQYHNKVYYLHNLRMMRKK